MAKYHNPEIPGSSFNTLDDAKGKDKKVTAEAPVEAPKPKVKVKAVKAD